MASVYQNTNGVPMADGRNLHMGVAPGEVANRVITVGTTSRAEIIASFFDETPAPIRINSSRGFLTITGYYQGVRISVVAIGMGPSMMDFFVREVRAVVDGPMAIIRFGTCGGLTDHSRAGTIVVATEGSSYISRNYDFFPHADESNSSQPYNFYKIAPSDQILSELLTTELNNAVGSGRVMTGLNITADSFYSSQNRIDDNFDDYNTTVLSQVENRFPAARTLEMETFILLHLASCSKAPIRASSAVIVVAHRNSGQVIDEETHHDLELNGGKAVLNALKGYSI